MEAIHASSPQSPAFELTDPISRTTSRVSRLSLQTSRADVECGPKPSPDATLAPSENEAREKGDDAFDVHWDGPDDPDCPLNMSMARKW